jgi:hypothetical protein
MIPRPERSKRLILALGLALILIPTWTGQLDTIAQARTHTAFENALVTFAVARGLNGVISVAQGTELAFQPAGVGVIVSAGEILDPLNDLVEQFSWLTLLAASSLGAQIVLSEMFATAFANAVLTLAVVLAVVALAFAPRSSRLGEGLVKLAVALALIRFALVFATLSTSVISASFLNEREQASVAYLSATRATIETTADTPAPATGERDTLGRLSDLLDEAREAVQLEARIDRLQARVEGAISHIVNLIVVYTIETILLPVALLIAAWALLKFVLRQLTLGRT